MPISLHTDSTLTLSSSLVALQTDKIVTYNPLWHAVMKLAHSSGMGEAFGAVLLGAKGLSSTFPALLPFSTNATTLAEKLGMAQVTHADCMSFQVAPFW